MRRQYHFRRSERGLLAWDVYRLVRLARGLEVFALPLSEIRELDEPYWFDAHHPTTREFIDHMRLTQEADLAWPIIVCPEGRVMDGMHRVAKAALAGHTHINAVRLSHLPEPDHVNVDPDDLNYDEEPI